MGQCLVFETAIYGNDLILIEDVQVADTRGLVVSPHFDVSRIILEEADMLISAQRIDSWL